MATADPVNSSSDEELVDDAAVVKGFTVVVGAISTNADEAINMVLESTKKVCDPSTMVIEELAYSFENAFAMAIAKVSVAVGINIMVAVVPKAELSPLIAETPPLARTMW